MAGPNLARGAQERAAKAVRYDPLGVNLPGFGGVSYTPEGAPQFQPDPFMSQQAGLYQGLFSGAGRGAQELQPGVSDFGQRAFGVSGGLFDQVSQLDPLDLAEERYNRLLPALTRQRERQRGELEGRLFSQGRLDSTGGNILGGEFEGNIAAQDAQLLNQLYGEAEASRSNLLSDALSAGQSGAQTFGGLFSQLGGAQGGYQQAFNPLLQAFNVSRTASQDQLSGRQALAQALQGFNTTQAAAPSTPSLGSQLLRGGINAAANYFTYGQAGDVAGAGPNPASADLGSSYSLRGAQGAGGSNGMGLFRY